MISHDLHSRSLPKTAIFGANGFIGMHLCKALVEADAQVIAFDRTSSPAIKNCDNHLGDFENKIDVQKALKGCHTAIHLIHTTLPTSSNVSPFNDAQANILSTIQFLETARQEGTKRVIYISSGGTVYGPKFNLPISEQVQTSPVCAYAISKLAIEGYLALYHRLHGIDYIIVRLANPYGLFQSTHKGNGVIATFIECYLKNKPMPIWGNGLTVRDYIHIDDVVAFIIKAMQYEGPHRIFNVGSGIGTSINQIISLMESILHQPMEKNYLASNNADIPQNILNIQLAKNELGWHPTITLYEGIRILIKAMRETIDTAHP